MECWPEIWPIIGPQIEVVMRRGSSTWNTNQLVPINRNGKLEEVFWTYSYSPVRDKDGSVQGTLVVCTETTEQVLNERRLRALLAIAADSRPPEQAAQNQDPGIVALAAESQQLSDDLSKEIRTLSYLLHPPLLDEAGVLYAWRWYVEGFSERSKIKIDLDLPENMGRLPHDLELVIFRVIQESSTNIHRHSGSLSARIQLACSESTVGFEISDQGKGISQERQKEMTAARTGVGVRGMQERVRQFGGTLRIISDESGTKVVVALPLTL